MRFYRFSWDELVEPKHPNLETDLDPKAAWALRHPEYFPVDPNRAPLESLLRVPGIGPKSARLIVEGRRHGTVRLEHLKRFGVVMARATPFLWDPNHVGIRPDLRPDRIRRFLVSPPEVRQLSLFASEVQEVP